MSTKCSSHKESGTFKYIAGVQVNGLMSAHDYRHLYSGSMPEQLAIDSSTFWYNVPICSKNGLVV